MDKPDMDLLVKCAIEAGASVTIADNGNGGIYINGEKITDVKKLLEDVFNGIESEDEMYDKLIVEQLRSRANWLDFATPTKSDGKTDAKLLRKPADAIEDLNNRLNLHRQGKIRHWIPLTERLPEHSGNYLVYSVGGNWKQLSAVEIAFWDDKRFIVQSFFAVTHWMPLPEPPESEE